MFRELMESETGQIRKELFETRRKLRAFEAIANRSPAAVFLWRLADDWPVDFVYGNVTQFGFTRQEFLDGDVSWVGMIHPDDLPWLERERGDFAARGIGRFTQEYRLYTRSGEIRWVEDRALAICNGMGMPTHYQGIILDVTKRKRLEEMLLSSKKELEQRVDERTAELAQVNEQLQRDIVMLRQAEERRKQLEKMLQQAQKMEAIGTLASGIAHDFNNILGGIMGFTELALLDLQEGTLAHKNLKNSLKAQHRASEMVNQILAFSRQTESDPIPVNLSAIVKEAVKLLRMSIPSTIEIVMKIEAAFDRVIADPSRIHQILMNLCTNAAHAMRVRGGKLVIGLSNVVVGLETVLAGPELLPGRYVELSISDTGHGIDPLIRDKIFDPFFTTKSPGEGTGMGLAVVHGIVQGFRGAIDLESTPGEGTRFRVLIPAVESSGKERPDTVIQMPRGQERILFVDDEEFLVRIGEQALCRLGYQVMARTNSIEALEMFRVRPESFDAVITDLNMPDMSGIDLSRELLQIRPDIPIILCTGFSKQNVEEKAKKLGIRECISKPLIMNVLARTIRDALERQT